MRLGADETESSWNGAVGDNYFLPLVVNCPRHVMLAIGGWMKEARVNAGHSVTYAVTPSAASGPLTRTRSLRLRRSSPAVSTPPRCRATPRRLVRPVPHNTLAAALLQRWLAPITAGRAPAQVPLLVIDASAWSRRGRRAAFMAERSDALTDRPTRSTTHRHSPFSQPFSYTPPGPRPPAK